MSVMVLLKDARFFEAVFHMLNVWFSFVCCICYIMDHTYRFWHFRYIMTIGTMLCSGFRFKQLLTQFKKEQ